MRDADTNKDGKIQKDEFVSMMVKLMQVDVVESTTNIGTDRTDGTENWLSQSQIDHEAWEKRTHDLLSQCRTSLKRCQASHAAATSLRKARVDIEASSVETLVDGLKASVAMLDGVLNDLASAIEALEM